MRSRWFPLAAMLLFAGAGFARGVTIDDVQFEDPLWGDPVEMDSLKDRTVVVYYWAAD